MENPTPFSSQCCEFWQLRVMWLSPQLRHRMNALFTEFSCGLLKMAPVPISHLATTGPFSVPGLCVVQDVRWATPRRQLFEPAPYLGSCIWDSFVLPSRVHCVDVPHFAEGLLSFLFFLMVTDETAGGGLLRTCHLYRKAPDWAWQLVTVASASTSAPDPFFLLYSTGFLGVHCGTSHMLLLPWLRCLCETSVSFGIWIIYLFHIEPW